MPGNPGFQPQVVSSRCCCYMVYKLWRNPSQQILAFGRFVRKSVVIRDYSVTSLGLLGVTQGSITLAALGQIADPRQRTMNFARSNVPGISAIALCGILAQRVPKTRSYHRSLQASVAAFGPFPCPRYYETSDRCRAR